MKILPRIDPNEARILFENRQAIPALESLRVRMLDELGYLDLRDGVALRAQGAVHALDDIIESMNSAAPSGIPRG